MKRIIVSSILICSVFLVQSMQKNNFHFSIAQKSSDAQYLVNTLKSLIEQWSRNEKKTSQKQRARYNQIQLLAYRALTLRISGDRLLTLTSNLAIIELLEDIIQQECDSTAPDFVVINQTTTPRIEEPWHIL